MALGAVLVDSARKVSRQPAAVRVEGTTPMATVHHPWFRARLFLPGSTEGPDPQGAYRRSVRTPQLLYALRNGDGEDIDLRGEDEVEVNSTQLGRAVWRVNGEPEKLRRKRGVLGHLATLERVDEGRAKELEV